MKREQKERLVQELRTVLEGCEGVVVAEYKGMSAASSFVLRRKVRQVGGRFRVAKNTLVRKAVKGTKNEALVELLGGPVAVVYTAGDVPSLAKTLRVYAKEEPALKIRGGILEGKLLTLQEVEVLAEMPSKRELQAKLLGLLKAPLRELLGVFAAVQRDMVAVLKARLGRLENAS